MDAVRWNLAGRLVLLAVLVAPSACYSYKPTQAPVPVGSEVRATLTQETALAESELLGVLTPDYQGRVTGMTGDSIMISVVAARAIGTATTQTVRRTVKLPLSGVQQLSERSLSGAKTAVAIGATAAVAAAILGGVLEVGGNGGGDDGGGGDTTFRPGFRLFWPF